MRLAATILIVAGAALAADADPISGVWKGDMAPRGAANRRPLSLDLKFDGVSAITGSASAAQSFPLKSGSFDPKTGALKIVVQAGDGEAQSFTFDGMVVEDIAVGRVAGQGQTGDFKLVKQAAGGSRAPVDASNDLRRSFAEVSAWVTKAADLAPAEKYAWRPVDTVRTFGQIVAHIADSYNFQCGHTSSSIEKGPTDKATVVPKLKQALDACAAAYQSGSAPGPLVANLAHTNLHYGNLITYLRLLGLKPPSN